MLLIKDKDVGSSPSLIQFTPITPIALLCVLTYSITSLLDFAAKNDTFIFLSILKVSIKKVKLLELVPSKTNTISFPDLP